MRFITVILKEVLIMNKFLHHTQSIISKITGQLRTTLKGRGNASGLHSPFNAIVEKELSDHVRSWRFIILVIIIALTCFGSIYSALSAISSEGLQSGDSGNSFLLLRIFTISDGTLPSFIVFISFLGPLLGISLGFDAINSEQNNGTLSHILAQPIHRDYILNAKFVAALKLISLMFFVLVFLVMGFGLLTTGLPPTAEEFWRILFFIFLSILYVAFWLNLSILFSVIFRQPATSALVAIGFWLFTTVFYPMIVDVISSALEPGQYAHPAQVVAFEKFRLALLRVLPSQLFNEATSTLLVPSVRSLGPLTMQQTHGAIPGPLPLGQSILISWGQIVGLIAATVVCFVIGYISFMRREVRSG